MSREPTPAAAAAIHARSSEKHRAMLCETFNTLEQRGLLDDIATPEQKAWWAQQKPLFLRQQQTTPQR